VRAEPNKRVDHLRRLHPTLGGSDPGANWGYFEDGPLRIISSGAGDEWEHVSVSCADRCPTWDEMSRVKALFWSDEETVLQFHPRRERYVNAHRFCLHLWKQRGVNALLPPTELV
jgi:hypothetical protein